MVFLFFFVSFAGWGMEVLYCMALHAPSDRGFLRLPLCPIYGVTVVLCLLLLGTPDHSRIPVRSRAAAVVLYWLAASLLASGIEFGVGLFFDRVLHTCLWSYAGYPFHVSDYVFLPFCALWGILATLFLGVCLRPLDALVRKIPTKLLQGMDICLLLLVSGECILRILLHFLPG